VIETSERSRLEVRLVGPAAEGGRLRVDALIEVAGAVQTAVTRLAYGLRGEATVRKGRTPRDIAELTRLEVVGLQEGSTILTFDLAEHERPLADLDLGLQALEIFEAGAVELAGGRSPRDPWDEGVREAIERLTPVFEKGIDEVIVGRPGSRPERRAVFSRKRIGELRPAMAPGVRQRVEVEGRLLMADFAATRDEARIHRALELPVRCRFGPELEGAVLRLLRRYVRAQGWAEVDEQGRIKTLELESLEDAEPAEGRSFWELTTLDELAVEQGIEPVERLENLVSGFWPEDESVDDFLAAIESRD
jgi:hypothetical protein